MKHYSIKEVTEMTGYTASALRIWEQRYCWPRSQRLKNGYRSYSEIDVEEIKKVARVTKATGKKIGELIVDGFVVYEENLHKYESIPKVDFSELQKPTSKIAIEIFSDLTKALTSCDIPKVRFIIQMAGSIKPSERSVAITEPIKKWVATIGYTKKYACDAASLKDAVSKI